MRDYRIVSVTVNPFVFDPVNKTLEVRNNITLRIHKTSESGVNELTVTGKKSASFENLYKSAILNYDQVRDAVPDYQPRSILIITGNNTQAVALVNQLVDWKRKKGFHVLLFQPQIQVHQQVLLKTIYKLHITLGI